MSTSVLERSSDLDSTEQHRTAVPPAAAAGTDGTDTVIRAPRGYVRATLGLFALWAVVVAFGIVMQSGPALSFG